MRGYRVLAISLRLALPDRLPDRLDEHFGILAGGTELFRTAFRSLRRHLCDCFECSLPLGRGEIPIGRDTGFGTDIGGRSHEGASGVEHHFLGPFVIRTNANGDLRAERRLGTGRNGGSAGEKPVRGKKPGEKNTPDPSKIMKQGHGRISRIEPS